MQTRYRLTASIRAILDKPDRYASISIPAGALLYESSQPSTTLLGMVGVLWEGRHYSVSLNDLLKNGERFESA
jgi:hypothetical protein